MAYRLIKSAPCSRTTCTYSNVPIGGIIMFWLRRNNIYDSINVAMKDASKYNDPAYGFLCECQVEVKDDES